MSMEELIIRVYWLVDEIVNRIVEKRKLRERGYKPKRLCLRVYAGYKFTHESS